MDTPNDFRRNGGIPTHPERLQKQSLELSIQVRLAFRIAFAREVTRTEQKDALAYARRFSLPRLCRLLCNANEFLFVG